MSPDVPFSQPSRRPRRDFLKLTAASTVAAGLYAIASQRVAAADPPPIVGVLMQDLPLVLDGSQGTLNGLQAGASGVSLAAGNATGSFVSPALTAANPFTHAGLRWASDPPDALDFELRWSADGNAWSTWQTVRPEQHTPPAGDQAFGALLGVDGRPTHVQLRALFDRSRGAGTLSSVTVTLLNSRDGPSSPAQSVPDAQPSVTGGNFYTREQWGADESLRFDATGAEVWPRMYVPVKKAMVHHTDTRNDYVDAEDAKSEVRAIYAYHAVGLGWGDIGYNALIDKWGNIYEGRRGRGEGASREVLSSGVVAGHALKHNYGSTGVALLGTHTAPGENDEPGLPPTQASQDALVDFLAFESGRNNVNPQQASDFLLSTDEWNRGLEDISGHRNCFPTICPGGYVYPLLPSLRQAVADRLKRGASVSLQPGPGYQATLDSLRHMQFDWQGAAGGGRFLYLLEGWRLKAASEDVDYLSGFDTASRPAWQPTDVKSAGFGDLLQAFGSADAGNVASGHFTFHVMALDDSGKPSFQQNHTLLLGATDQPPVVTIASPADGATPPAGTAIAFQGAALDPEDGDLSYRLAWRSSRDGAIGQQAVFSKTLSAGDHVITATASDSNGNVGSASIRITVH